MFSTSLALSVGFLYKIIVIVRPFYALCYCLYCLYEVKKQEPKSEMSLNPTNCILCRMSRAPR